MAQPLVTVIIAPAHEPGEAMESLKAQTFTDFETILPDPAHSVAQARNAAIRRARGQYIAFLDSTHSWKPRKLELQVAALTANPNAGWCYSDALQFERPDTRPRRLQIGNILGALLLANFVPPGSVIARRSLITTVVPFDETPANALTTDWDMCLRIAAASVVECVPEQLVLVRMPPFGHERRHIQNLYDANVRLVEKTVVMHPQLLTDLRCRALADLCLEAGNSYLRMNLRMDARHKFAEALTHNSTCPEAYLNWASSFLSGEAQRSVQDLQGLARFSRTSQAESQADALTRR